MINFLISQPLKIFKLLRYLFCDNNQKISSYTLHEFLHVAMLYWFMKLQEPMSDHYCQTSCLFSSLSWCLSVCS